MRQRGGNKERRGNPLARVRRFRTERSKRGERNEKERWQKITSARSGDGRRKAVARNERADKRKVRFSRRRLVEEIMTEAKILKRPDGATKIIAEKVADEVGKWAEKRTLVTEDDITRMASKNLKKYDEDLAYIYENRGKII